MKNTYFCGSHPFLIRFRSLSRKSGVGVIMNLTNAQLGTEYTVKELRTGDEELNAFLFTLGCYTGEPITVISRRKSGCTVSIKDGRYNIDKDLASAILV